MRMPPVFKRLYVQLMSYSSVQKELKELEMFLNRRSELSYYPSSIFFNSSMYREKQKRYFALTGVAIVLNKKKLKKMTKGGYKT